MKPVIAILLLAALSACQASGEPTAANAGDAGGAYTADPSANPALGRWVEESGQCTGLQDVEIRETEVRLFPNIPNPKIVPMIFSNREGNSILMTAGPKRVIATRTDETHLKLVTDDGRKTCILVRY